MLSSVGLALLTDVKKYGYAAVFFGVMLENAGIPVPGETVLLVASGFASQGKLSVVTERPWGKELCLCSDRCT